MTHPLPKPPPCPPDPWPDIGKAWNEMQQFREMTWEVMIDMMMTDPRFATLMQSYISRVLVTDPGVTTTLQTIINQQLVNRMGVTDASDAAPGAVGEFVSGSSVVGYGGYPAVTTQQVSPLVLQPGDWDIRGVMQLTSNVDTAYFALSQAVTGIPYPLFLIGEIVAQQVAGDISFPVSGVARGNFSVPTPLPFEVVVINSVTSSHPSGTATLTIQARRMR